MSCRTKEVTTVILVAPAAGGANVSAAHLLDARRRAARLPGGEGVC